MKELYAKIMASEDLQKKVMEILAAGEEKGEKATQEALVAFAKEQGYEVTFEEIQEFLEGMQKGGELSDDELDMVAGGKGGDDSLKPKGSLALYKDPRMDYMCMIYGTFEITPLDESSKYRV